MDVPGWYGFRVEVGDGRHSSTRDVWVHVVEGDRPPVVGELTNRAPVRPDTRAGTTRLTVAAHDPDGDELSYGWTVAAAPAGAAPRFEDSSAAATEVEGLTEPGRYRFRVAVSDGPSETVAELAVDVREPGGAPRILALEARREEVLGGELGHVLVAEVEDPDGGAPSCWWRFVRGPEGARPWPLSAGRPRTVLRGLDRPGTYVFELTAVDADGFARDEVAVTVE